ncbi:MAG: endonuclease MutS2 [Saprospiraceae bacterium]|nr:endonuclease MutS2 [Saprospiraceae bacterium]
MILEPKDIRETLEFDKIVELLQKAAYGEPGRIAISQMPIETDVVVIERKLEEVAEYKRSIEKNDRIPFGEYESLEDALKFLEVVDYVLPQEELLRIASVSRLVDNLVHFFAGTRQQASPCLYDLIRPVPHVPGITAAINRVLDEQGNIRADASAELAKIRRTIGSKQKELERVFRTLINEYRKRDWLTDNVESFRNGRRVLSVPAEHKRKIRGIIHDESTTGRTAFIEPDGVIDINNDIFDLFTEEKREIYRIIKDLCTALRPHREELEVYEALLVQLDVIQAKASLAMRMKASKPRLANGPSLGIQMGRHPLLILKNKELNRETVPFDLTLFGKNRILVLSGPNAGGKSVTMKATGLLQLMVQAGILVPVDEISEFGVFNKIFADIGDQQSLEDDLSTYSSRLTNMRVFLEGADEKTLLLIDEFGSGTDPKIGGAIAEAILKDFNERKSFGVITTHYSNLKIFAFKTPGIVNASMLFDKEKLAPTYQLKVGRPGSSYAFEIAEKTGLPDAVIQYAKKRTGKSEKAVDELLVDLQQEAQEVKEKLEQIREQEKNLDKLVKNYENLHRDLEFKRKKIKLEQKEQSLQQVAQENKVFEQLVRQLKEEKNLEKAKKEAQKIRQSRQVLDQSIRDLREDVFHKEREKVLEQRPLKEGDFVKMISGGATGKVESINRKKAVVLMGHLRMTVNLRDLELTREPLEINAAKSIQTDTTNNNATFESKIDIRGMRMEEALEVVQDFVDQALMTSSNHLQIVHGKGNGVLREAVKRKLKEYRSVNSVRHPEEEFGGDGVTVIELK